MAQRLVDANAIKAKYEPYESFDGFPMEGLFFILDRAPTIDPVVRCRDCAVPHNKWTGCPKLMGRIPSDDFYCADGVKREDI